MKAFVYFNLHKKCWSIRAKEGSENGRVLAHATSVAIADATTKVSEAGRQRVIKEGSKNVHAGVVGELVGYTGNMTDAGTRAGLCSVNDSNDMFSVDNMEAITYNPYKSSNFLIRSTGNPVPDKMDRVVLTNKAFAKVSNHE